MVIISSEIAHLFETNGLTIFQKILLVAKLPFLESFSKYTFFVFLNKLLHLFLIFSKAKQFSWEGHFWYLFFSLYFFIIALLNS